MSIRALNWAWEQRTGSPTAKAILAALADLADETHSCYPAPEWIADRTEVSLSTVQRYLKQLEEAGYLRRERRYLSFGKRSNDRFILPVGQLIHTPITPLDVNLTSNEPTDTKPLVTPLDVNLTSNGELPPPLDVNCDIHIDTPEKIDKSIFIEDEPSAEAAAQPDPQTIEIDMRLGKIHPSLSVAAITARVKVANLAEVDVLRATQTLLSRATRTVHHPVAFVAAGIDRAPEAWKPLPPGFEPGSDLSGTPTTSEARRAQRHAQAVACAKGVHDWGPEVWPEHDRAHCLACGTPRRDTDATFRAVQDEHDLSAGLLEPTPDRANPVPPRPSTGQPSPTHSPARTRDGGDLNLSAVSPATVRAIAAAERGACERGDHDWGPAWWPIFDRSHCQRAHCGISRYQVDQAWAALADRDFDGHGNGQRSA